MSTIAAIATSLGSSGVNIIRISGEKSLEIVNKIFKTNNKLNANNIVYGKIINNKEILDHVLVSYFKSPNSFTGEDVCEINCHGGTYITKSILKLVLDNGAILASPGEFTKRAFLNGKLDLSEAESVINLINAKTKLEAKLAINKLEGSLFNEINLYRDDIVELLAKIEVSVDYPEYDYEDITKNEIAKFVNNQINGLNKLISSYDVGKYIKEGVNVGIFGKPNVRKIFLIKLFIKKR